MIESRHLDPRWWVSNCILSALVSTRRLLHTAASRRPALLHCKHGVSRPHLPVFHRESACGPEGARQPLIQIKGARLACRAARDARLAVWK